MIQIDWVHALDRSLDLEIVPPVVGSYALLRSALVLADAMDAALSARRSSALGIYGVAACRASSVGHNARGHPIQDRLSEVAPIVRPGDVRHVERNDDHHNHRL